MKVTILGTGTSQGVPVIGCECDVCKSKDPKDKRLRASLLIQAEKQTIVIDSGPDFRQQLLRENLKKLDALVFTHEHKDHTAGLDDVRAFNFIQKRAMNVYAHPRVQAALKMEFSYIFAENKYPGVPDLVLNTVTKDTSFYVGELEFHPIEVLHYKLPVEEKEKIQGTKVLVINALRREEHISHMTLDEALALISEIKPEKAYLTHISHAYDRHENIQRELPENVFAAYDGLKLEI